MVFYLRENEAEIWESLKTSIEGNQSYLMRFPNGKYRDLAEREIEKYNVQNAWLQAKTSNSIAALYRFRQDYPDSEPVHSGEVAKVISNLEEEKLWLAAQKSDTLTAYNVYLERSILNNHFDAAQIAIKAILKKDEATQLQYTLKLNTVSAYKKYLEDFPQGDFIAQAKIALEKLSKNDPVSRQEQSVPVLQSTMDKRFKWSLLAFILSLSLLIGYILVSNNSDATQLDNSIYSVVIKNPTIPGMKEYLEKFPKGVHTIDVHRRLTQMEKKRDNYYKDAELLFNDNPQLAQKYLDEVLRLDPNYQKAILLKK